MQDTKLHIVQGAKNEQVVQLRYVHELYESQKNQIISKDDKIVFLETELTRLKKAASKQIPFYDISAEAKANYENLVSLEYDNALITDFKKVDTLTIFQVSWAKGSGEGRVSAENKRLYQWLKIRLKDSTVQLRQ